MRRGVPYFDERAPLGRPVALRLGSFSPVRRREDKEREAALDEMKRAEAANVDPADADGGVYDPEEMSRLLDHREE